MHFRVLWSRSVHNGGCLRFQIFLGVFEIPYIFFGGGR